MKGLIKDILVVLVVVLVVSFFIKPIIVKKTSMLPTLQENNYLLLNKQAYTFGEPKRGDIVVFPVETAEGKGFYVKRVIGLPGEEIDITGEQVYINNALLEESYTAEGITPGEVRNFIVPQGELYVMGDNRTVSLDSRSQELGTIPIEKITGVAIVRLYPFDEFGRIK